MKYKKSGYFCQGLTRLRIRGCEGSSLVELDFLVAELLMFSTVVHRALSL